MLYNILIFENERKKGYISANCSQETAKCAVDMIFERKSICYAAIIKSNVSLDIKNQKKLLRKIRKIL